MLLRKITLMICRGISDTLRDPISTRVTPGLKLQEEGRGKIHNGKWDCRTIALTAHSLSVHVNSNDPWRIKPKQRALRSKRISPVMKELLGVNSWHRSPQPLSRISPLLIYKKKKYSKDTQVFSHTAQVMRACKPSTSAHAKPGFHLNIKVNDSLWKYTGVLKHAMGKAHSAQLTASFCTGVLVNQTQFIKLGY